MAHFNTKFQSPVNAGFQRTFAETVGRGFGQVGLRESVIQTVAAASRPRP